MQLSEYEVIAITRQNFEQVFKVYDANQDFFMLVQGKKATIESSLGDIDAIPPDCGGKQKVYISIWKGGKAIGVLDLIAGYPEQTSFWIGLLLVHGDLHGKGIGSKIVRAVLDAAKISGYHKAKLGVVESNIQGLNFWEKHGFNIMGRNKNIVVMARPVV